MATSSFKTPPFDHLLNFRDVGQNVNEVAENQLLKPGIFFRSATPDNASEKDRDQLRNNYHIKTILDLRTTTELLFAAKKHSEKPPVAHSAIVPRTNNEIIAPMRITGMNYEEINLNGKGFERSLVWKLKYTSLAWMILYMAMGYRKEGISILGKEVMQPRGLIGIAMNTLEHSGPEIKQIFDLLADESTYPILVHCTHGKDRTGLVIILALLLCGVDNKIITADYVRSESELAPEKEKLLKELASYGLDESFATCPPRSVDDIANHLQARYGGIEAYFESIGIGRETQHKIKNNLTKTH